MKTTSTNPMIAGESQAFRSAAFPAWINRSLASALLVLFSLILLGVPQASAASSSIWNDSFMPATPSADAPVTLGVKFQSQVDGYITGIRFYKAAGNTGNNVGSLWTTGGIQLGSLTFTNETAGGWQQQLFASPVAVSSNTTHVATYFTPSGFYAATMPYFSAGNYVNSPLVALGDGVDGGNGVYAYGAAETFPTATFNSANYWVDVVFTPALDPCEHDTNAPAITKCAADRTLAADANGQAAMPDLTAEVLAQDDCPGALVVTQSLVAGSLLGVGQHPVTLTVTDASGNSATCAATLTVEQQTLPPVVIGNFVWNDLNQNGIQDAGEPGLPGVRVQLYDCSTDGMIATQFTDAAGGYQFEVRRTNSVYLQFARPAGYSFSPRNQGADDTRDSDVDPAGKTECFALDCPTPTSPGCIQTNWDAGMYWTPGPAPGVASPGYWKNHPELWPATLTIGGKTYTSAQARALMSLPVKGDASLILFRSFVAARLNVLSSNESSCISDTLAAADQWLASYPGGSGVRANSLAWKAGEPLHLRLDAYNNGRLCAPKRESQLSVGSGGGNDRACHLRLRIDGEPGTIYCVQESTNTVQWVTIATVTNAFGLTDHLAQVHAGRPHSFFRLASPGAASVAAPQNGSGTFMELENHRCVTLFPLVYDGNLILRGNDNVIKGPPAGQTTIAGDLVIYGNANCVSGLKILGNVILKGNANTLRNSEVSGILQDTGNGNLVTQEGLDP